MHIPDIELYEARTLDEAVHLLARYAPSARLLAGGTDLLVDLKAGRTSCAHLVSLNRIAALHGVSEVNGSLRIGALTTITQLAGSPIVQQRYRPLLDATGRLAAQQIRNVATVGGNVAAAVPCADLPPILTAMDATVVLFSGKGEREVALNEFFVGPRQTVLGDDELLSAVLIPKLPSGFGAAYARFGLRDGNTIAVAAVAASLLLANNDTVEDARIVLGAVAPVPKLARAAGAAVAGHPPDEDAFARAAEAAMAAAEPISDVRGSADFRRELVGVLTRRALTAAHSRAREAQ